MPVQILQLVTMYIYSSVTLIYILILIMDSLCHCHSLFSMTPMTLTISHAPEVIKYIYFSLSHAAPRSVARHHVFNVPNTVDHFVIGHTSANFFH